ncbi:4-hydroxy-2-oxovalerate aldolase [Raineyella sp. LH-20]|uniref:4-hydroxy-2-oxovalerate aldolase n=1 Tax=Raineyella sp. LH-20 TaxID=3081204 RepID=UPI002955DC32|nr:4-hydroxy-2-oxovalerate aldolase [Raineyella sp. LH-20]WOP18550.1 4-hydroxy-2-oxovalerate aldolase [Raineyella sp. LH-20]
MSSAKHTLDPNTTYAARIIDTTLRDGSHAVRHQFTIEQVKDVTRALDAAGVDIIEVTHGDGLAGSSFNYGFSKVNEMDLIEAAKGEAKHAKIAALMLPGLGTLHELREAKERGIDVIRIATHCTEADVSIQHFQEARTMGLETAGFLMLSHMIEPDQLAKQARIMADAGCQCVYVVDSAGAMILDQVGERVRALKDELGDDAEVGFHGHQNMSFGVANSVYAVAEGATWIDGSLRGLGAGAGNSPTEVLAAAFERLGIKNNVDTIKILAAAEDVAAPIIPRQPMMDRASIIQGKVGVYNSFLFHAERAADRYGVPVQDILEEAGRRGYVGGQEDMLIDVAVSLASGGSAA